MARPAPPPTPWWPALAGGVLCAALLALDAAWGFDRIISATVVIAPFLTALRGTVRQTAWVGAMAVAGCALSGAWNENFGSVAYLLRLGVVGAGASFAVLAARTRIRLDASRARVALIASLGDVIVDAATLEETVERLGDALVPAFADLCVVDIKRGGDTRRLAARAHGPHAARLEAALGHDGADTSSLSVTMRAGGRDVGTLGFVRASGRRFGDDDRALARVLAGRAALALDNAGLSTELETAEAQLGAALGSLAEAVTVQDATGTLVYANEAAAAVLGFESASALLSMPPAEIVDRYDTFLEDGSPLTLDRLPGRRVLAGEQPEPLVVRAVEKRTGEERWRVVKATAVRAPDGRPRLAVNVVEDITEVKRAELTQRLLARAGEVLSSTLDADEALRRLAAETVPQLADWCSVHLVAPTGEIRSVAVAHVDPAMLEFAREYRERWPVQPDDATGPAAVIRTGVSELLEVPDRLIVESVSDPEQLALLRTLGLRSVMVVPIAGAGAPIGALRFVSAESRRMFVAADLALAEELGRRAGTAVEHARLYEERSRIARTLQTGLLPARLPVISGWASAAMYHAAGEENLVGGDFYDAFAVDHGWMLVVGDVIGRGAEAATLTAVARSTLRATGRLVGDPIAVLEQLNRELLERPGMALCTVACLVLRETPDGAEVDVVCAGHPRPLLVRDGRVEPLGRWGPLLGAFPDERWATETQRIGPGDIVVLYTDGVLDTQGQDERFGEERLASALAGCRSAEGAVSAIDAALSAFQAGEQTDDTAVLAVQRTPALIPAQPAPSAAR
jgi:PAS domain S-box-containing protein